jgi:hypothetical protein
MWRETLKFGGKVTKKCGGKFEHSRREKDAIKCRPFLSHLVDPFHALLLCLGLGVAILGLSGQLRNESLLLLAALVLRDAHLREMES